MVLRCALQYRSNDAGKKRQKMKGTHSKDIKIPLD
jgi:hypothetical protein